MTFIDRVKIVIRTYTDTSVSSLGLSLFRIFFYGVVLLEILQLYYFRHLIFDLEPFTVPYRGVGMVYLLMAWASSTFMVVIGLFTRTFKLISWLFMVIVFAGIHGTSFEYHHDHIMMTLAFLSLFMPLSKRLSVDAALAELKGVRKSSHDASLGYSIVLVLASAGVTYFDSVFTKYDSFIWTSGLGVWWIPARPYSAWVDISFLLDQEYIMYFFCYLTIAFEFFMVFLIWFKWGRVTALIIGVGMHIIILFTIPIPLFALGMLSIYILLIPDSWYKRLFGKFYSKSFLTIFNSKSKKNTSKYSWVLPLVSPKLIQLTQKQKSFFFASAVLFIVVNQASIIGKYNLFLNWQKEHPQAMRQLHKYHYTLHLLTGMKNHPVVSDGTHRYYNYMVLFEYESPNGEKLKLPHYTEKGLYNIRCSGRIYRNYTFDIGGGVISENRIKSADAWLKYFAIRHNVDLQKGKFNVLTKYIPSPRAWEKGFLKSQRSKPWKRVGEVKYDKLLNPEVTLDEEKINALKEPI